MSTDSDHSAKQKSTAEASPSLQQSRASIQSANGAANQDAYAAKEHRSMGYPAFSSLLSSDNDAFVARRFGSLHVRTILFVQDEITQLEDRLAKIDKEVAEAQQEEYLCHNGSFRGDKMWHRERYEIMQHLPTLLEKYDRLVTSYSDMQKRPKALKRTVKYIDRWFDRYPQAITVHERGFLEQDRQNDLIATADRLKAPLRRILEKTPLFYRLEPFHSKDARVTEYSRKYQDQGVIYYDDDLVDKAITIIILLLGLIMLLVPAWLLKGIDSHTVRLALITGFIALFVGLLLLTTPTKPFETMIGTAAYGALLMVFMQIDK
ncbi:uncharacterized protein BKCO1_3000201 [Diplodia corticola]|uniref:DUF6594 domain-containing protein n=1 Tax=Diplodia corticola TaxID=236234 RepID=A0A1J9RES7_9PEZI|nr:uncharacterized protein BKCO1_3000201 [Diplodia corticola]OJD38905.1 hypothetical protein BKCO1_3000201 [Diplodia corticola]